MKRECMDIDVKIKEEKPYVQRKSYGSFYQSP